MEFGQQLAKLDKAIALERLGGDEELLKEVAALFLPNSTGISPARGL